MNAKVIPVIIYIYIQGDQKVSVYLMITIKKSGAQRLFDHSVCVYIYIYIYIYTYIHIYTYIYIHIHYHYAVNDTTALL